MLFVLDVVVAIVVAAIVTVLLVRTFRVRGPWRHWGSVWILVFLLAWCGGVLLAPTSFGGLGWLAYALPFVLVGLGAAFAIALLSPPHTLGNASDREAFEREERAVGMGVVVFFWSLCALLLALIVGGYWLR